MINFSHDSRSVDRDSNSVTPDYESGVITTWQRLAVCS